MIRKMVVSHNLSIYIRLDLCIYFFGLNFPYLYYWLWFSPVLAALENPFFDTSYDRQSSFCIMRYLDSELSAGFDPAYNPKPLCRGLILIAKLHKCHPWAQEVRKSRSIHLSGSWIATGMQYRSSLPLLQLYHRLENIKV
jgi:hypothetical protein